MHLITFLINLSIEMYWLAMAVALPHRAYLAPAYSLCTSIISNICPSMQGNPGGMGLREKAERLKYMFDSLVKEKKKYERFKCTRGLNMTETKHLEDVKRKLENFIEKCKNFIRPRKNGAGKFSIEDYVGWYSKDPKLADLRGSGTVPLSESLEPLGSGKDRRPDARPMTGKGSSGSVPGPIQESFSDQGIPYEHPRSRGEEFQRMNPPYMPDYGYAHPGYPPGPPMGDFSLFSRKYVASPMGQGYVPPNHPNDLMMQMCLDIGPEHQPPGYESVRPRQDIPGMFPQGTPYGRVPPGPPMPFPGGYSPYNAYYYGMPSPLHHPGFYADPRFSSELPKQMNPEMKGFRRANGHLSDFHSPFMQTEPAAFRTSPSEYSYPPDQESSDFQLHKQGLNGNSKADLDADRFSFTWSSEPSIIRPSEPLLESPLNISPTRTTGGSSSFSSPRLSSKKPHSDQSIERSFSSAEDPSTLNDIILGSRPSFPKTANNYILTHLDTILHWTAYLACEAAQARKSREITIHDFNVSLSMILPYTKQNASERAVESPSHTHILAMIEEDKFESRTENS